MNKRSFPLDPKSGKTIRDLAQPGYYPKFSTLKQKKSWDEATRQVVVERVQPPPPIRFFQPAEAELLQAILDRILPQDDRDDAHTIPILPAIDQRLYKNELNGFRYEEMPPDREAYHLGLKAIDEMAQQQFQTPFAALPVSRQETILKSLHDGKPNPENPAWKRIPVHRFWAMLMEDCVTAYYAHPWSWDEIGFGGPAYPRGYMRLENGLPEPWETDESRYEWLAPADSLSDLEHADASPEQASSQGRGGTHG